MIALEEKDYIDRQTYLVKEEKRVTKHEYVDGQIYAMAGASDAHVTIAGNIFTLIKSHIRGKDCRVYISDMKAYVEATNSFFYPDVMVSCEQSDRELKSYKASPSLIIEVLSPSTEAYDRGQKFHHYRQLSSLKEYLLISQQEQQVDCFRRQENDLWLLQSYQQNQVIHLENLDLQVSMVDLYEDVIFPKQINQV